MSLKDLKLKTAYDSDEDDILNGFYIPALSESIIYKRLAGFFTSTSLAIAAKGIAKFITNNGKIYMITNVVLSKEDYEKIKEITEKPFIEKAEIEFIKSLDKIENELIKDHVKMLGWMIKNQKLEIKVAVVKEGAGIQHQKTGILEDGKGNVISFSGSDNETKMGWIGNIEEFHVFCNWKEGDEKHIKEDIERFDKFWNDKAIKTRIYSVSEAVNKKLIRIAPKNDKEFERLSEKVNKQLFEKNKEKIEKKKIIKVKEKEETKIILRDYQKKAIKNWFKNDCKGIFEMATGTGKTFAALGCLKKLLEKEKKIITIIVCPYGHLIQQWKENIQQFNISTDIIIADNSNSNWKNELVDYILDIRNDISEKLIILTTNVTFSMKSFINITKEIEEKSFLIVDEVHSIGAPQRKEGLLKNYCFKLGLSATPRRWLDEEGTKDIFDFFGDTIFEFSLKKAINTINPNTGETYLCPYEYKPYFVELTEEELSEYEKETEKIAKSYYLSKDKEKRRQWFTLLCIKRQKIIKNAKNKFKMFEKILNNIGKIKNCLIYCSPKQIDEIQKILNSYEKQNIIQHKFTNKEGVIPKEKFGGISEREFLLQQFAKGKYDVLVAMKCLDEGVDVPPVKIAIILASSGNPKQYIQRRGRVLRHYPGKEKAIIYDIIVVPIISDSIDPNFLELERKILKKELIRYKEFANAAKNTLECLNKIYDIEEKYHLS